MVVLAAALELELSRKKQNMNVRVGSNLGIQHFIVGMKKDMEMLTLFRARSHVTFTFIR